MKHFRSWLLSLVLIVLLLSTNSCAGGAKPDFDTAVQTVVAATLEARAPQTELELKIGETISSGAVEIFNPPKTQGKQPAINISPVSQPVPPAPSGSVAVGDPYEVTAQGKLAGPVLLTLRYNPAQLPRGVNEENLYIAVQVGDRWEEVPNGIIDTKNHTVNVVVSHFSPYRIFENTKRAVYGVGETLFGDEVVREHFGLLPEQIMLDLKEKRITPQAVKAVVNAKLSTATKGWSGVIAVSKLVSKTSGLVIARREGRKELQKAVAETIIAEGGGKAGNFAVMLYDAYSLGTEMGQFYADPTVGDPAIMAAKGVSLLLAAEMEYIDANMDKAFNDLWKFNPLSVSRLQVYAVHVDAEPLLDGSAERFTGVKYYYYDEWESKWINYYDNIPRVAVKRKSSAEVAQAPKAPVVAPAPGALSGVAATWARPTATPRPAATSTPRLTTPSPTATLTPKPAAALPPNKSLIGTWVGKTASGQTVTMTFKSDGQCLYAESREVSKCSYAVDFSFKPAHLDIEGDWTGGKKVTTIIEFIDENTIRIQGNVQPSQARPVAFGSNAVTFSRQ